MRCPACAADTAVVDSRVDPRGDVIRRRRQCVACRARFTTKESQAKSISHAYDLLVGVRVGPRGEPVPFAEVRPHEEPKTPVDAWLEAR